MPPLTPLEAIQRLNEPVTVEMPVKASKSCTCSSQFFLDCEENKRDPKNLGVIVTTAGAARFKEHNIADPADHFQGKTIRVRGTVILKDDRPYIEVDDPAQIEVVG
jgi:hypothetical protein